jgi:hypothetical protein
VNEIVGTLSPLAGEPVTTPTLVDVARLTDAQDNVTHGGFELLQAGRRILLQIDITLVARHFRLHALAGVSVTLSFGQRAPDFEQTAPSMKV